MKKIILFLVLAICSCNFFTDMARADDDAVNWSGTFVNKETNMMLHNNSVRINKLGVGFFPTGFYQEENIFLCSGTVALGEDLQARVSNFMFYKYEISEDGDVIVVSRDANVPMVDEPGCTSAFYGTYVRIP